MYFNITSLTGIGGKQFTEIFEISFKAFQQTTMVEIWQTGVFGISGHVYDLKVYVLIQSLRVNYENAMIRYSNIDSNNN